MSPFNIIPSSFFNKPWHRFTNGAGEEIPAYACMRITGATETDNDIVFTVAKPNASSQDCYLVNGPLAVGDGGEGRGTTLKHAGYVLVGGGPVYGNQWGPTNGSWEVSSGGTGFLMLGTAQSDPTRAPAIQKEAATPPNVAFFRLTAAKEMSGTSAAAVLVTFNGSAYVDGTAILACDPYRITTGGAGGILGKFVAPSGAHGYGMKRNVDSGSTPEYDIIDLEHYARLIRGRLTSPRMGLNDSGLIVLDYIENGITPPLNGDGEILVHDDQELFPNALGEDLAIDGGAEVIATLNDRLGSASSPYYQVTMADQRCRNATARLGQTMCGETHFQVIIEGFESSDDEPFSQIPKPRPTTAYNPFRHRARNDGRRVALRWMKVTDPNSPDGGTVEGYCIIDVPKNKRKVAFDYRISADKTKLEALRAECAVEYCEDPQWERIFDGKNCT